VDRSLPGERSEEGARPPPQKIFLLFDLNIEHFGAVFKLDLTEETRTKLQEGEAIASHWLRLCLSISLSKSGSSRSAIILITTKYISAVRRQCTALLSFVF